MKNGKPSLAALAKGEWFTGTLSLLALAVSLLSAYIVYWNHEETVGGEAIREAYSTFFEVDRLQLENWQVSHIFTTPGGYDRVKADIVLAVKDASPEKLVELRLKERVLALHVFDNYEQILFLLDHAKQSGQREQARFLQTMADYFTSRILRNPRLLFYWSTLADNYEGTTQKEYAARVLHNAQDPLTTRPDAEGPFARH